MRSLKNATVAESFSFAANAVVYRPASRTEAAAKPRPPAAACTARLVKLAWAGGATLRRDAKAAETYRSRGMPTILRDTDTRGGEFSELDGRMEARTYVII
jgi:hypothetical protein